MEVDDGGEGGFALSDHINGLSEFDCIGTLVEAFSKHSICKIECGHEGYVEHLLIYSNSHKYGRNIDMSVMQRCSLLMLC